MSPHNISVDAAAPRLDHDLSMDTRLYPVKEDARAGKPVSPELFRGLVRISDLVVVAISGLVSYLLTFGDLSAFDEPQATVLGVAVLTSLLIFNATHCYSEALVFAEIPKLRKILTAWMTVTAALLVVAFGLRVSDQFSRTWALLWFGTTAVLLVVHRIVLAFMMARVAERGLVSQRSVIVGAGELGQRLANFLDHKGKSRVKIIGFVDDRRSRAPDNINGHPVIGTTDDLFKLVRQGRVDQVFVALPWNAEERLKAVLERLAVLPVNVKLAPDLITFHFPNRPLSNIEGLPVIHIFDRPISGWSYFLKTMEDRILASLFLIAALPLFLLVALAVRLDSPGPVLFRQQRYGFNNQLIKVYKFRTMYHHMTDHNAERLTTKGDPRVTRIGRFLRRTSIDELPQLMNVLLGQMSIVGPRPHAISAKAANLLYEEVSHNYMARHKVKPGITGWAQVHGWRGETNTVDDLIQRVEHDLYYIENWSISLDLWIILKTLVIPFYDKKAY